MKRLIWRKLGVAASYAAIGAAVAVALGNSVQGQELNVTSGDHIVHIFPTVTEAGHLALLPPGGPLTYHGGPVMTKATTYAIFWLPASGRLQNGTATNFSSRYIDVQTALLSLYPGHGIDNNN